MGAPKRLKIDAEAGFEQLAPAARVLLDGGVLVGPTQSFYALMSMADHGPALERLLELKPGRTEKAFLILLDQEARCRCYARDIPEIARPLMENFWPGLLSLLFMGQTSLHPSLMSPARTVGLRVEGLPLVRRLVRMVDRGLTGTSANPPGEPAASTIEAAEAYFGDRVDLYLDIGPTAGGAASTVVDVSLDEPRLVRDGALPLSELQAVCPTLRL